MIKAKIPAQDPGAKTGSYEEKYRKFSWEKLKKTLHFQETGKINIAHEAVDRWADDPEQGKRKALVFEKGGIEQSFSYRELKAISCQWANLFTKHGFRTGDRLFILLQSCPEIYFAMLACARIGVLFCPLFASLSIDELEDRIHNGKPRGILTEADLAEGLPVEAMRDVEHVFLIDGPPTGIFPGEILLKGLPEKMPVDFDTRGLSFHSPLYLLYTSGSTGPPKGVVHSHGDMLGHIATADFVLDIKQGSVFWADCDPAWVTGTVYGAFAPWLRGAISIVIGDPQSPSKWYRTIEKHKVEIWYKTPGTMRKLIDAGEDLVRRYDFSSLRHIAVVGEALVPELIYWFRKNFGLTPHDTWWMTETGMICIANFPFMPVKPGSMGRPVPGVQAAVVDENGVPVPPMTMGELVLRTGWPCMMTEIWNDRKRYEDYFRFDGWFLTGDMVIQDEEGYFYHQGRTDDLIKAGVKLIGPYEIERVLCRHPAVNEAAVISRGVRSGESFLKAFISIAPGYTPSTRLNREVKAFVKAGLSEDILLKEVQFIDHIPRTRSGKVLRRALRTKEMGL